MASKNPFGTLSIRRDQDEEENRNVIQAQGSNTTQPLFQSNQNQAQKKKKVRPEAKKAEETQVLEEEFDQGFTTVKKSKAPTKSSVSQEEALPESKEKHSKNKGAYQERNFKVAPGKRDYDRRSGTGRGKEISKGGAGGKHTWGANPKNIVREEYNEDEKSKNNFNWFSIQ
jgi:hypothetical protein